MATEEVIEEPNVLIDAISKLEARLLVVIVIFLGLFVLLFFGKISAEQFIALLAIDGLLYQVLKKI